ncbi:MAG: TatD family hydrolase [bacterium]|jgi:TatD DNase family protein|nr:MAG: hydrolase TatD [bacterium]
MFFDSHCHLTDARLVAEASVVVERARAAGVTGVVTVASDAEDAVRAVELAEALPGVWATAGIHPHMAAAADEAAWERIAELAGQGRVVALGETGLDYHYDHSPRPVQRQAFVRHIELAREFGLPLVVHSRSADEDTAAIIREAGRDVSGVLHCFAGGAALLEAGLEAGWMVSFSGLVTFRNYDGAALVRTVPADRLLVETDAPYLAPVPHRGRRNEPAFVRHVAEGVALLRGEAVEEVAAYTTRNARAFYRLEPASPST